MKRYLILVLAVIFAAAACTPKENPSGDANGVTVKATMPAESAMPNKLCVYIDGTSYRKTVSYRDLSQDKVLTASIDLPVGSLVSGSHLIVYIIDDNGEVYSGSLSLSGDKKKLEGYVAKGDYVDGDGTEARPFLIANARQLKNMMTLYQNASAPADKNTFKRWFRLLENVSAASFAWVPLNNSGSFFKAIDFDGLGHTISGLKSENATYASFAGVLYGSVRNVTFDGATISHSNTKKGVVAGFLGTTGLPGSCENVHVTNSTVSGGSYSGGFAGHIRTTGTIDDCSVENTTVSSTNNHVGGFAAALDIAGDDKYEVPARLTGCSVKDVTVTEGLTSSSDAVNVGGFIGASVQAGTFQNCTAKATVNAGTAFLGGVGGFVGGTSYAGSNFKDCAVLNGTVINAGSTRVGGFVGYSQTADIYNLCSVSASVSGNADVGGFAGLANGSASFTDCSASGTVTAVLRAGGFIGKGDNVGCYACSVNEVALSTTNSVAGGFIGNAGAVGIRCCYAVITYSGNESVAGSFMGENTSNKVSISHCIGWHASLPFSGHASLDADIQHVYSGNSGTVSSQASAAGWPAVSWDFSGAFPTRKEGAKTINAIFVGDSITWQWGRREGEYSKTNYPLKIDFNPAYMVDNGSTVTVYFHPGFFSANGYIDKGISGQNTTQMKARFKKDVLDLNPIAVVIMGGTNDLAQGVTKDDIVANIASMAADATAADIKVVLCSVTPNNSTYSKLTNPNTKGAHIIQLNTMLQALCTEKGYTYCNYWNSLVADDGLSLHPNYCLYDLLHPGPDGYDVMEPIIKGILDSI